LTVSLLWIMSFGMDAYVGDLEYMDEDIEGVRTLLMTIEGDERS